MKRLMAVFSFALAFLLTQNLMAQRPPHHGPKDRATLVDMVKEDLNLTEEQETQLATLREEFKKERKEMHMKMREGGDMDRRKMHEHMKQTRETQYQKVLNILNSEQQEILKAKKAELDKEMEQRHAMRGEHRAELKKMHDEMKAYKEQNIIPTLEVQRAKLETVLSEEDKATIAELRPVFAEMKQRKERTFEGKKERKERPTPEMREKKKAEHKAMKERMKPHMETLAALVEKYDADIQKLHEEIENKHNAWKEDIKGIHEKYKPEGAPEKGEHPRMEGKRRHGHHDGQMKGKQGENGQRVDRRKIHFLLMEPAAAQNANLTQNALTEINVFPNPASILNTINYEVKQAGQVRIELKNDAGKTLRVLSDGFKEVGEFSIEVDLAELRDGVYYYTITDGNGVISKKIVVSK